MKKLAILFLLTAIVVGGVFAQSVKAQFTFNDVTEANNGVMTPALALIFNAAGSKELGPGSLAFELQVAPQVKFGDAAGAGFDGDDNFGRIGYNLAAGPGTLGFGLKAVAVFPTAGTGPSPDAIAAAMVGIIEAAIKGEEPDTSALTSGSAGSSGGINWVPEISYTGIAAGPATIGAGFAYTLRTVGVNADGDPAAFGRGSDDGNDALEAWVDAALNFGLYIKYKFAYEIGGKFVSEIAYLDVNYQIMEPLKAGVELSGTGAGHEDGDMFKDLCLKPYAEYALNENMSAGLWVKLENIAPEVDGTDLRVTPAVWFKYAL